MKPNAIYNFEPITKEINYSGETIRISYQNVTLSKGMYLRMEKPEYIGVYLDEGLKALGIKVTEKTDQNALKVTAVKSQFRVAHSTFIYKYLVRFFNIGKEEVLVLKRGIKDGGYYIFDLNSAEIQKIRKIKKHNESV